MKRFYITIYLLCVALSLFGQRESQLHVVNIKEGYTEEILYMGFRYKGAAKMYLNGISEDAEILFNYKLDISPLEIRPSKNSKELIVAGGLKSKTALYRLDTLLNLSPIDKLYEKHSTIVLAPHDFQFLPNGHLLAFAPLPDTTDVSKIVEGGVTNATIVHFGIFEIDTTTNHIIHQWNSKDHFSILETGEHLNLKAQHIDYFHLNSIQYIEHDQTVLLSSRDMSEITKVKWPEGQIVWRMGGKKNEFEFLNDEIGFTGQHQARMYNDTLLLFDNGTFHKKKQSSAVMYQVDEKNKVVRLLHRFYGNDVNFTKRRGGVKLLKNGNLLISWGQNQNRDHNFSELSSCGETLQKGFFYNTQNYRINKGHFKPKLLSIQLKQVKQQQLLQLLNHSRYLLTIKNIYIGDKKLKSFQEKVIQPTANQTISLKVEEPVDKLNGYVEYEYKDIFYVKQDFQIQKAIE